MTGSSAPQLAQDLGMPPKKAVTVSRTASMVRDVSPSARGCPAEVEASA